MCGSLACARGRVRVRARVRVRVRSRVRVRASPIAGRWPALRVGLLGR